MTIDRVVVVGASLAGLRAAETLRNDGFSGAVTIVGAEPHRPYDRPPLSKKLLAGEWDPDRIALRQADTFDELDVEWRLGMAATGLDLDARELHLTDGSSLGFAGLIIATGATPRRLPGQDGFDHVHELRTVDDAMALRTRLAAGDRRVAVVGAGFIGLEVAATARILGNDVTVLELAAAPLAAPLGHELGEAIGALHRAEGVDIRCGVAVDRLADASVVLMGGEEVAADEIVVGIGVEPATGWLAGSGLELRDGVVCDGTLGARRTDGSRAAGIFAAGDVARWTNPLYGEEMRVEHWTNAAEQGALAARNLLAPDLGGAPEPYAPVPFFWSDQYRHRIQFLGRAGPHDEVEVVAGDVDDANFLALYHRDGVLRGALGVNAPRWVMKMRGPLLERVSWDDGRAAAIAVAT
ncbi:MAG: NAD(P)/FAD-dependent oxidoreductase [Ilumatobacteraceae bacterium]